MADKKGILYNEAAKAYFYGDCVSSIEPYGGGDSGIVNDFLDMLINETEATERTTTLEHSLESHFMALAAEESRLRGGELINMDAFKNGK